MRCETLENEIRCKKKATQEIIFTDELKVYFCENHWKEKEVVADEPKKPRKRKNSNRIN